MRTMMMIRLGMVNICFAYLSMKLVSMVICVLDLEKGIGGGSKSLPPTT
jgi:hypothetical protein